MAGQPKTLRCLGADPTPPTLEADLRTWLNLPSAAREGYEKLLVLNLAPEFDDGLATQVKEEIERLGVDGEAFVEDLMTLVADEPELVEAMRGFYGRARPLLRGEIVAHTIGEHGNLATRVAWRVDHITRSQRGLGVDTHVAVFTFHYKDGKEEKSFTLQLMPETIAEVGRACADILAPPSRPPTE